jgi:hypothetical protein
MANGISEIPAKEYNRINRAVLNFDRCSEAVTSVEHLNRTVAVATVMVP